MKQTISFITLGVGDLARSRAFYRALGWRESSASQEAIAFYQAGSKGLFSIILSDALRPEASTARRATKSMAIPLTRSATTQPALLATTRRERVFPGAWPRCGGSPWNDHCLRRRALPCTRTDPFAPAE